MRVRRSSRSPRRGRRPSRGRTTPAPRRTSRSSGCGRTRTGAGVGLLGGLRADPTAAGPDCDVSATECTASASIDELPVIRKPTNFADRDAGVGRQRGQDGAWCCPPLDIARSRSVRCRPWHGTAWSGARRPGGSGRRRRQPRRRRPFERQPRWTSPCTTAAPSVHNRICGPSWRAGASTSWPRSSPSRRSTDTANSAAGVS